MELPAGQMTGSSDALSQAEPHSCHEESANHSKQVSKEEEPTSRSIIVQYLLDNVEEFRHLSALRKQGWSNTEGDQYFAKQRQNADNASQMTSKYFYRMMKEIGREMHQFTGALAITNTPANKLMILDMCMAPGGFLATVLDINPYANALGLSLPISQGGHRALLPQTPNMDLQFLDITMLATDMGVTDIPAEHPDAKNMLPRLFEPFQLFQLVICDGQVLRTHTRAAYREKREARRLITTQLALGLEHLESGGTMIILLHKVEAVDTVLLLHTFCKFSTIRLFKPAKYHAKRSSFYLVATDVQSQHGDAIQAVKTWKEQWKVATFGSEDEYKRAVGEKCGDVEMLLAEFGEELVRLGREVWRVQASALERAPFIRKG